MEHKSDSDNYCFPFKGDFL